jgi:hypothetical protein
MAGPYPGHDNKDGGWPTDDFNKIRNARNSEQFSSLQSRITLKRHARVLDIISKIRS